MTMKVDRASSMMAVPVLLLALSVAMVSGQADAVTQQREFSSNAADSCQSALPVFDVQIRKRPLAVQNEGTASAFVTCAYGTQSEIHQTKRVEVYYNSTSGAADTLSCTFVTATNGGTALYIVKSVNLAGDGTQNYIQFNPSDFGGGIVLPPGPYGISCNLKPGMGVNQTYVMFTEDVGA